MAKLTFGQSVLLRGRRHRRDKAGQPSSGSNVIPRRARPGLAGLRPHNVLNPERESSCVHSKGIILVSGTKVGTVRYGYYGGMATRPTVGTSVG